MEAQLLRRRGQSIFHILRKSGDRLSAKQLLYSEVVDKLRHTPQMQRLIYKRYKRIFNSQLANSRGLIAPEIELWNVMFTTKPEYIL